MLKKINIGAAVLLLAGAVPAHASSTGLLLNDDSVQILHSSDPATLFGHETRQAYNFIYSQEPDPRNLLLGVETALQDYTWEFLENHTITPRLDLMVVKFMGGYFGAAAVGASYRIAPSESRSFTLLTEVSVAPPLTTLGSGKSLWSFKTQINYPLNDKVELNAGYRSITMKLPSNVEDGFERGLYLGITTYFE